MHEPRPRFTCKTDQRTLASIRRPLDGRTGLAQAQPGRVGHRARVAAPDPVHQPVLDHRAERGAGGRGGRGAWEGGRLGPGYQQLAAVQRDV